MVIDDQPRMVQLVTDYLQEKGMRATGCLDGEAGLAAIADLDPDVVVLDLMLPSISGEGVCRAVRAAGNDVPIIMLTARGEVRDRVRGLELGADDYLVKPFALEELYARIKAVGRRRDPESGGPVTLGDVVLDPDSRRVWVAGEEVPAPRMEFDVLAFLMQRPGKVVTRDRLHEELWEDEDIRSNSLEVHVSRVRRMLRDSAALSVVALRGVGYRLDVAE